jgi:sialic acid synthase SpsE/protoporphyrinogen oxidase
MKKIVIIGAGPTGLVTAHSLSEKTNYDIKIFEANSVVGGLASSGTIDGMSYDCGPHIFHSGHDDITDFWKDNFGDLLLEKPFYYKNYKDGILYDYPISWESIEKFPKDIKDKVKYEIENLKPENLKRSRNFKECVEELVGPTLQNIFFEKYTEKLWGISPEKMSSNWAPKRIHLRRKHKSFWSGQYSACGKYGAGKIMERLSKMSEDNGVGVYLNHKVIDVKTDGYVITDLVFDNGTSYDVSDSIIVSTIPLNVICKTLDIPCSLTFNSVRLVYIVFSKDIILPKDVHSIYYAHDDFHFHRITEQKQYSGYGYPKDKTLLIFEISYTARKHLGEISDEQLVSEVLEQTCELGLVEEKDFVKGFSKRLPHVNPVMTLGYEKELSKVNSELSRYNNLHLAGGAGEFMYGDVQTMVARGWDMADLLSSKHYEINKNLKRGAKFKFNDEVELFGYKIGKKHPTLIIAEIGINHRGYLQFAKDLIKEAKESGCEIAKLQTYNTKNRVSDKTMESKYADRTLGMEESTNQMFSRFELSYDEHLELINYAKELGIPLISTPFDEESVDILMDLGVQAFKIASFDIVNLPFIRYVASKGLPIILSTGMSQMSEIEDAIDAISQERNPNLVLLHCVSAYPCDISDINLKVIDTMRKSFGVPVGYSDHTVGTLASNMAFTLGVDILEKHFTLDKLMEGPDHILSADPEEMKTIVSDRNEIFIGLGDGIKRPASIEYRQINLQRKALFTKTQVKKGEVLTLDNISIKGPGLGLLPKYLPVVLGKRVTEDIGADLPITWDVLLSN